MSEPRPTPPATALVTRRVRHGQAKAFERLMAGMQASATDFPGHMGGFLIPPEQAEQGVYRMLFAFDTEERLQSWMRSGERQRWIQRIAEVTHGDAAMRVLSGLETWFELPAARTRLPPARWKMAIVTWMGIFPLVLLTSHTVTPALGGWIHPVLVALVSTGLITTSMTWLVMPVLVPLFSNWLYPDSAEKVLPIQRPSEKA